MSNTIICVTVFKDGTRRRNRTGVVRVTIMRHDVVSTGSGTEVRTIVVRHIVVRTDMIPATGVGAYGRGCAITRVLATVMHR